MNRVIPLAIYASLLISGNAMAIEKEPLVGACAPGTSLCALLSPGGFYASGTGYYIQPSETGLGLFTDSWQYSTPGGVYSRSKPFNPDYEWEWAVKLGYDLPNSANSIEVRYFRLDNHTHAINDTSDGPISFGSAFFPDTSLEFEPGDTFVSDAHLTYKLDQADLVFGRSYAEVFKRYTFRPKVGVRYLDFEHRLTFAAPGYVISKFDGAGPLLGVDGRYALTENFGLVGNFEYAAIVGEIDSRNFLTLGQSVTYRSPKQDRVINNIVAKVGLDFAYPIGNGLLLAIEGGYEVGQYFNSSDIIQANFSTGPRIVSIETNHFSYQGPYATLTIHA
ncbi:major outer membrane protein [Legionella beliardensis]|uniref:Major outer membrane protein n=1 Tax=Legionella beliardensis TaxID=91822 RepID=A0A378JXZ2_9GAMM|nr:Lpg1974 family pore-forming outer membrane protein [Legionella beliardensis]STX55621.1 major outer membrane protein [Legionella beliardensis]